MNRNVMFRIVLGIFVLAALVGVAFLAFGAGVSQSMVQNGDLANLRSEWLTTAPPYAFHPMWMPFGFFGFGALRCLSVLAVFFLIGLAFRLLFGWHRPHYWGGPHRHWHRGDVPPFFEEWHTKAHEPKEDQE
jgi:hypothetical protein